MKNKLSNNLQVLVRKLPEIWKIPNKITKYTWTKSFF